MKRILVVAAIAVAAFLAWKTLSPGVPASPAEAKIATLEHQLDVLQKRVGQANRNAGLTGLDPSSDILAARSELKRLERDLATLKQDLDTDAAKSRAQRLEQRIAESRRQLGA